MVTPGPSSCDMRGTACIRHSCWHVVAFLSAGRLPVSSRLITSAALSAMSGLLSRAAVTHGRAPAASQGCERYIGIRQTTSAYVQSSRRGIKQTRTESNPPWEAVSVKYRAQHKDKWRCRKVPELIRSSSAVECGPLDSSRTRLRTVQQEWVRAVSFLMLDFKNGTSTWNIANAS